MTITKLDYIKVHQIYDSKDKTKHDTYTESVVSAMD